MKKSLQKKTRAFLVLFLTFAFISVAFASSGTGVEPGSEQDPIITKSYVDEKVENLSKENSELKALIQQQNQILEQLSKYIEDLKKQGGSGSGGSNAFEVVTVENGQVLLTVSGTEIVLRSGRAKAIKGEFGGLSDVTSAKDLTDGVDISLNHLLISARDDGRGARAFSKCYFLIRGAFKIIGEPQPEVTPSPQPTQKPPQEQNNSSQTQKTFGVVTATTLNVRAKPDTSSQILAKLRNGDQVEIVSKSSNWYQILTSAGIKGWVSADFIRIR